MTLLTHDLSNQLKTYLCGFDVQNCFGITLTLKQQIKNQRLDKISSSQNLKHFLNILNKQVFGNSVQRFNRRLKVLPVLETSTSNRLHYHLTLENPFPNDPNRFKHLIESCWKKTKFGYDHVDINDNIDQGWNDYITKFNNKEDEVDWINFNS